jgi:hypothetical protein
MPETDETKLLSCRIKNTYERFWKVSIILAGIGVMGYVSIELILNAVMLHGISYTSKDPLFINLAFACISIGTVVILVAYYFKRGDLTLSILTVVVNLFIVFILSQFTLSVIQTDYMIVALITDVVFICVVIYEAIWCWCEHEKKNAPTPNYHPELSRGAD